MANFAGSGHSTVLSTVPGLGNTVVTMVNTVTRGICETIRGVGKAYVVKIRVEVAVCNGQADFRALVQRKRFKNAYQVIVVKVTGQVVAATSDRVVGQHGRERSQEQEEKHVIVQVLLLAHHRIANIFKVSVIYMLKDKGWIFFCSAMCVLFTDFVCDSLGRVMIQA